MKKSINHLCQKGMECNCSKIIETIRDKSTKSIDCRNELVWLNDGWFCKFCGTEYKYYYEQSIDTKTSSLAIKLKIREQLKKLKETKKHQQDG